MIVALYVVVGRAYPERLRPAIMAAFAAGWVVPSVVGPLASGAVTEHLGWRWVFVGIPVLVVVPLALALPQIRSRASGPVGGGDTPASFDGRRIRLALAISLGAGLLQYAAQDLRWVSLLPGAAGVALLVPAVLGLLPRGTYRAVRGLPSVVLLRGVAAGSFIAAESFVPLMLVTQRGLSPTLAGLSLAAGGATWAGGSWLQSRPRLEPHRERLMALGMLLVAAAITTAPSVLIEAVPAWTVAVAWAFGCFGMGLVISSTSVLLLKLSAPRRPAPTPPRSRSPTASPTSSCCRPAARPSRRSAAARSATRPPRRPAPTRPPSRWCSCRWRRWRWRGHGWRPGYGSGEARPRPRGHRDRCDVRPTRGDPPPCAR